MFPVICTIGPITIYSYGLMMAVAVLVCARLMAREAGRRALSPEMIYDLALWCVVGGISGARIFYILLNISYFTASPQDIIMIQKGGLAWQGGFIGGALAGAVFTRRRRISLAVITDLAAPFLALGQAIGRIGCFLNGCCYGRPLAWGVYCPVHGERLHPTQLYDTVALFFIFLLLRRLYRRPHRPGQIFVWYLILASAERFINEFFRGDHVTTVAGLSVFQWMSLAFLAIAGVAQWWIIRRPGAIGR